MSRIGAPVVALFLIVLGALTAALWWAGPFASGRQWHAPEPREPNLDAIRAAILQHGDTSAAEYPGVLERPLFNSSRRKISDAAPSAPPAPPPPEPMLEGVAVSGIISGPLLSGVMVQDSDGARFVRVGDQVQGWTLARLDGRTAVFRHDGKEQSITLEVAEQGGTAPDPGSTTVVRSGGQVGADAATAADLPAVVHPSAAASKTSPARGAQQPRQPRSPAQGARR